MSAWGAPHPHPRYTASCKSKVLLVTPTDGREAPFRHAPDFPVPRTWLASSAKDLQNDIDIDIEGVPTLVLVSVCLPA